VIELLQNELPGWIALYGYWVIGIIIALESMGIPLPGETTLVSVAIYAGVTGSLSIEGIIAAAALGAIIGDNVGYWIGRELGYPLLLRYGRNVWITEPKIKLGRYLFVLHGGKVVFFGRFVAILRVLAALLAGANRMPFLRFFAFNAVGGALWAVVFGMGAYLLGSQLERLLGPIGVVSLIVAALGLGAMAVVFRRHQARLQSEAERVFPEALSMT
jgi:membrane protein DedA with SNARE-associated domain